MTSSCIFCRIIKGELPGIKIFENKHVLALLDIKPLSIGHTLVIPKHCGEKLTDIPDDQLKEILIVAKDIAQAAGFDNWNILQNNGQPAHQEVLHVHFHLIPKPDQERGLRMDWKLLPEAEVAATNPGSLAADIRRRLKIQDKTSVTE